jgi:hypothetical protein
VRLGPTHGWYGLRGQPSCGRDDVEMTDETLHAIISVDELRHATRLLLDGIERTWGPNVDLQGDHYWLLEQTEAQESLVPPTVSSAGSQSDDVESIRELLRRAPDEGDLLWHDLSHLTGILSRIGGLDRKRFAS